MYASQRYASTDEAAVRKKTVRCLMYRPSPSGMATTHTAEMTIRLKAAEPTMVDGPSSPE